MCTLKLDSKVYLLLKENCKINMLESKTILIVLISDISIININIMTFTLKI